MEIRDPGFQARVTATQAAKHQLRYLNLNARPTTHHTMVYVYDDTTHLLFVCLLEF
jgi:hypothetical protein